MPQMDGFDPNAVADEAVLPAGVYSGIITKSEIKPTKSGGSQYVFTVKLTEPHANGKVLFWRIHKVVANPAAQQIADRQLKALCMATRIMAPRVTEQFHNITIQLNVVQAQRLDTGELANEIKSVVCGTPAAPSAVNAQHGLVPAVPLPPQPNPVPAYAPPPAQYAPPPVQPAIPVIPVAPAVPPPWAAKPSEPAK